MAAAPWRWCASGPANGASIRFASAGPASYAEQWTESGGFGPSIPTKQRMPNQSGGTEPAARFFALTEDEAAIPDEARTAIDISGPPNETVKSRGNRLLRNQAPLGGRLAGR